MAVKQKLQQMIQHNIMQSNAAISTMNSTGWMYLKIVPGGCVIDAGLSLVYQRILCGSAMIMNICTVKKNTKVKVLVVD